MLAHVCIIMYIFIYDISIYIYVHALTFLPVLTGGGGGVQKVSNTQFSHFVIS